MPNGITVAIAVSNFTSPPPQIFNFQKSKVTIYVTNIEIIEHKMYLMLVERTDKNRLEINPKISREKFSLLDIIPVLTSKIAAKQQNKDVTII
jgi:hypothetical protein